MGLSYLAFACSIDAFASVYSSRDEALWEALVTSQDPAVRHYLKLDLPNKSHPLDVPEHLSPLRDVFVGAAYFRHPPHKYAYAHLACAFVLGSSLGSTGGSYGLISRLDEALRAQGEDGDPFGFYESLEWPLPGLPPLADWPQYLAFSASEVARRAEAIDGIMKRAGESIRARDEVACEFFTDVAGFYSGCAAQTSDLIVVVH